MVVNIAIETPEEATIFCSIPMTPILNELIDRAKSNVNLVT
jgi:hypothetical protein